MPVGDTEHAAQIRAERLHRDTLITAHRDRCCSSVERPVAYLPALEFHAEGMIRGCKKCVLSITTSTNEMGSTSVT